jgi:hypothetical protein
MVWTAHENVRGQYEGKENLKALSVSHQNNDNCPIISSKFRASANKAEH